MCGVFLTSLKIKNIDLIITTSPPSFASFSGYIISKLKKAQLVYDVRGIWPDVAIEMGDLKEDSFYTKLFSFITNFMCRKADLITTVSPGKVKKLTERVYPQEKNKVKLVSNGFNRRVTNGVIFPDLIEKFDLQNKFSCVYIGNVGLAQGLDVVIDIASRTKHNDVQFLIFGDGADKERLVDMVKIKKVNNIKFCGTIEHENVYTILKNAKMSIIPLKNSNLKDSIPTKLYESLGLGCPVFLIAEGDSVNILQESRLGVSVSPDNTDRIIFEFDNFVSKYDEFVCYRDEAMQLMDLKFSRQSVSVDFERQLKQLISL